MAIQFAIDSASDFDRQEAETLGLCFLPLTIEWEGKIYRDQLDISSQEFYEKLVETDTLPTTAQLSPNDYGEAFARLTANGDTVVVIALSSKLSGTCQSAVIAAADYPGKVLVVDSRNVTMGEQLLIRYALHLRGQGLDAPAWWVSWSGPGSASGLLRQWILWNISSGAAGCHRSRPLPACC